MNGRELGMCRVSTFDQNSERQLEGMPVARTFTDKAGCPSGHN